MKTVFAILIALSAFRATADEIARAGLLSHADDYVFGYYPYGWRNRDANGDMVFAIQSPSYALVLNASKAQLSAAGAVGSRVDAETASQQHNTKVLDPLPKTPLTFCVRIGETTYDAVAGAPKPENILIQRLGKYLVQVDVREISFRSVSGSTLDHIKGTITLFAWPDHARVAFQITSDTGLTEVTVAAQFTRGKGRNTLRGANALPEEQTEHMETNGYVIERTFPRLGANEAASVCMAIGPEPATRAEAMNCLIHADGIAPYAGKLDTRADRVSGWYQVLLGPNADIWTMERVRIAIENPTGEPQTARLDFAKRDGSFGITGMSPVLCDESGTPIGLPVQISKNWHCKPPWFDGITVLELAPHEKRLLEFRLAYAQWGGVPAVSHAQLALEGWGTHQLWDESAIGSFGESITYDPDVNLNRSMIDDVRPLMVWGMGQEPRKKWSWTHNVGGGDFLVLEQGGKRQFLGRQKTEYESQGPVLTTVRYSGETPDGGVQSHVTVQSWRSDDYVRGLYTLRYDVVKPVAFSRLAFFQLGADHYNTNLFTTLSRGDLGGEQETWQPEMGGQKYSRAREPLVGDMPWFAITGSAKSPPPAIKEGDQGAWADRGLIVHRWSARIGGKNAPIPHYSIFGTEDGSIPSALVELSPPPGVSQLEPGDYVDTQVEMVILPQRADDYYGPDEAFRSELREHGGEWQMVHREAVGTAVRVRADAGTVVSEWPIVIRAHRGITASFSIEGGIGYTPITIASAGSGGPFTLGTYRNGKKEAVDQSANSDWWQTRYRPYTKTYDFTFTIPLDGGVGRFDWELTKP